MLKHGLQQVGCILIGNISIKLSVRNLIDLIIYWLFSCETLWVNQIYH